MQGFPTTVHQSPISSPSHLSPSSSSSSSTSSHSFHSLSPSLSPAHSIKTSNKVNHHQSKHKRRPSPLKRQMSLGNNNGVTSSPATAIPFDINPLRSHTGGPLAVLYSVEPDEDPLLVNQSPTHSPSKNNSSLHSSPFIDLTTSAIEAAAPGTPRSVSALAALDRGAATVPYPPASPNRSLLSAFQAASPRSIQNITTTARSSSAPSLSNLNNGNARPSSPRGPVPQQSSLAPASPISTSPRQSTHRTSYATAAFRALNGASPQKQGGPSRSTSGSSAASVSVNVSPVRSRSSSALRQVQNDGPTWQIYRDADALAQSTSRISTNAAIIAPVPPQDDEEGVFAIDEDIDEEFNDNDENSIPTPQSENTAPDRTRTLSHMSIDTLENNIGTRPSSNLSAHRRSSLSMSSLPRELIRERDVTPPPSANRCIGGTQDVLEGNGRESIDDTASVSGSASRARKRLRTSAEMAL